MIKPLKNRKTPLQSKNKIVTMVNLFEKYIDEKIIYIDIEHNSIQTDRNYYKVDIAKNSIEKISFTQIKTIYNEPFD